MWSCHVTAGKTAAGRDWSTPWFLPCQLGKQQPVGRRLGMGLRELPRISSDSCVWSGARRCVCCGQMHGCAAWCEYPGKASPVPGFSFNTPRVTGEAPAPPRLTCGVRRGSERLGDLPEVTRTSGELSHKPRSAWLPAFLNSFRKRGPQ